MDPYLERHWPDVHLSLIATAKEFLNQKLPAGLVARVDERVYVEMNSEALRTIAPDLMTVSRSMLGTIQAGSTAVAAPVLLELSTDPEKEWFIEIRDSKGSKLITTIEFLSPANKAGGDGTDVYRKKREEILASDTNLVEIDLVRAGDWRELLLPFVVPDEHRTDYRVCVRRASRPDKLELYPIRLRDRLPEIAIPLRTGDQDVVLDLQSTLDRVYAMGRYDASDYQGRLRPALGPEDASWANERIQSADMS